MNPILLNTHSFDVFQCALVEATKTYFSFVENYNLVFVSLFRKTD